MVGVSALTQSVGLRTSDWCCSLVVFLALETKFLLFWTGQKPDSVLSRSTGHPAFTRSPSLSPTRPAPTPALASASPSAPEFFQRPKYLEPGPSPRESPGNTKTGRRLGRRPLPGRMGFPTGPAREGGGDYRCVVRGGDTNLLPVAGMP